MNPPSKANSSVGWGREGGRACVAASADSSPPTDEELETAIVRAVLDGRGAVAEVLADLLRARLAAKGSNVVKLR
jgi:hypothetical protein